MEIQHHKQFYKANKFLKFNQSSKAVVKYLAAHNVGIFMVLIEAVRLSPLIM